MVHYDFGRDVAYGVVARWHDGDLAQVMVNR